jgi:hypothetical protein
MRELRHHFRRKRVEHFTRGKVELMARRFSPASSGNANGVSTMTAPLVSKSGKSAMVGTGSTVAGSWLAPERSGKEPFPPAFIQVRNWRTCFNLRASNLALEDFVLISIIFEEPVPFSDA